MLETPQPEIPNLHQAIPALVAVKLRHPEMQLHQRLAQETRLDYQQPQTAVQRKLANNLLSPLTASFQACASQMFNRRFSVLVRPFQLSQLRESLIEFQTIFLRLKLSSLPTVLSYLA
jgi:hypothetical protein